MGKIALKYLLYLVIWCFIASAQALTLSNIELSSYLNQTLDARITVSGVSAAELESLEVSFVEVAAGSVQASDYLHAELVNGTTGQYIHISSKAVIREPVLTFTLELVWSAGKLQREYSLLMDPKN